MGAQAITGELTEPQFARLIDQLTATSDGVSQLADLLREEHPVYDQRGTAAIARMRGWILLALARVGVTEQTLGFVLEELDTGIDAYLVAAAANALRSYPTPLTAFARFVMRAINNIRYQDEPVSFDSYGEYATDASATSPVRELLVTLTWLGPHAEGVLNELEALRRQPRGFSKKLLIDLDRALDAIRGGNPSGKDSVDSCCKLPSGLRHVFSWLPASRAGCQSLQQIVFEDQQGELISFEQFFQGHPSIVVFFYTRCDNPLKCSLTVTKLARIQTLLEERGLANQIHTAAITYDPQFDHPERLRGYGQNRDVRMDSRHRMLRATNGNDALRNHFRLGVNFIESLVNRHRLEVFILDRDGCIAASFERLHWNEEDVVNLAIQQPAKANPPTTDTLPSQTNTISPGIGSWMSCALLSVGAAFFPKCPVCWAAYLSMFGIAGVERIPYLPWLQPVLLILLLVNVVSVWHRGRKTGRMIAFYLVGAGALTILAAKIGLTLQNAVVWGGALILAGSLLGAFNLSPRRSRAISAATQ